MHGCAGSVQALQPALTGAKAVVCTGRLGNLLQAAEQQGLDHIVVVSAAGQSTIHAESEFPDIISIMHLLFNIRCLDTHRPEGSHLNL